MTEVKGAIRQMLLKGQKSRGNLFEVCRPQCAAYPSEMEGCPLSSRKLGGGDSQSSCKVPNTLRSCVQNCIRNEMKQVPPMMQFQLLDRQYGFIA